MTTHELAPAEMEERCLRAEAKVARLERLDDPGQGLSPKEASAARERHLRDLEHATEQASALRREWEASSPEEVASRTFAERFRWLGRKQAARALHTAEDNALIRASSEALAARQREREARERLAALKEKRLHPPHPDAAEIVAAAMAETTLFEAVEVKLRDNGAGGFTSTHGLEPHEIGVLVVVLHLLRERGSVEVQGMSTSARWPHREPPLVPMAGLRRALFELRREGWIAFAVEGDLARVGYGPRVHDIAKTWGIELEGEPKEREGS